MATAPQLHAAVCFHGQQITHIPLILFRLPLKIDKLLYSPKQVSTLAEVRVTLLAMHAASGILPPDHV